MSEAIERFATFLQLSDDMLVRAERDSVQYRTAHGTPLAVTEAENRNMP
jgi:hypothetical protein